MNNSTLRPAATLVLARDSDEGLQVLMVKRSARADFMSGAYVFPGGAVDAGDTAERMLSRCDQPDLTDQLLAHRICAIRECFEEAGMLLAIDADGIELAIDSEHSLETYAVARQQMLGGTLDLAGLCERQRLRINPAALIHFSHWIAPQGAPKRFDTHFFVAGAPLRQTPCHDDIETSAHVWTRPETALERQRNGEIEMVTPTIKTLEKLACFASVEELLVYARGIQTITAIQPRLGKGSTGIRGVGRWEAAYAEIGKLDPDGAISACYDIVPGVPVRLSPHICRITAPNGNFMTGPGTNTYLLGSGGDIAVIDPGPAHAGHIEALLTQGGGRIRWILVTHTHPDHSPAAALLKEKTGAALWGLPAPQGRSQDASFRPERLLSHGERLKLGDFTLRVLHTPGHASNHLCYLLEEEGILFAGDHIMQHATVVIDPPDGDMSAYLDSLRALLREDLSYIAPGHGFLMDQPHQAVENIISHRLSRERKIYRVLSELHEADVETLLPLAYDDVHQYLLPVAQRSLLAHLLKLAKDDRASLSGTCWRPIPDRIDKAP